MYSSERCRDCQGILSTVCRSPAFFRACDNTSIKLLWTQPVTNCMVQRPSWKSKSSSASKEIPWILRNPKVHRHIYDRPPPVPTLSQIDPVHVPHSTSRRSTLILCPRLCLGLPKWSISLRFSLTKLCMHSVSHNLVTDKFEQAARITPVWVDLNLSFTHLTILQGREKQILI